MLADAVGDFGDVALVVADFGKIIELADEIEGAKGFPDLLGAGIDGGKLLAGRYGCSGRDGKRANAASDWRTYFRGALSVI